ncbi:MAG TPA: YraN family protein [Balneolales bacterium]|nr:YraN family protein [Balneolales bacterium]
MSTTKSTKELGDKGERLAVNLLENKGYTILEQNYRFDRAEVDIVAHNGREIIFVEVKLRSSTKYGYPEDAVTDQKKQQIFKAAEAWLYERKMDGSPTRFDVIAILSKSPTEHKIRHFENAFTYR